MRFTLVSTVVVVVAGPLAAADPMSKEACLDAHGRGQDAKEQGKLSLARKLFQSCSSPACPRLVQGDCARFADDLSRLQPSLGFAARDGEGHDLPDTSVYVDDVLLVTRLDGGTPHDVDPGKRVVRFQHGTREQVMTVIVAAGEKGRTVTATFEAPVVARRARLEAAPAREPPPIARPLGAKLAIGLGGAMIAGGATLGVLGLSRVPDGCSVSSHRCAASPGDPVFGEASSAVRLANVGFVLAGLGTAVVAGGIVWYLRGATRDRAVVAAPWLSPEGGGLAVAGRL